MSDYMDRTLELGYTKGAAILVTILLCLLAAWKLTVGNLSVDRVQTRKAELFYWVTILFSNTLGTALGDFLADDSGLGFLGKLASDHRNPSRNSSCLSLHKNKPRLSILDRLCSD